MPGADHFDRALEASFSGALSSLRVAQAAKNDSPSPPAASLSPTGSVNPRRRGRVNTTDVDAPPGTDTSEEKKPLKVSSVPIGQVVNQLSSLIKVLLAAATVTAVVVSALLILTLLDFYSSSGKTRLEYLKYGSAPRLAAETTVETFNGLLMAKNAFITALDTLTYTDEFDYATVETIVTPLFVEFPELHSIEMAFTESTTGIYMSKYAAADGSIFMQSDSDTCHSISNHACILHTDPNHSTHDLTWYKNMMASSASHVWSGPEALIQSSTTAQEKLTIKTGVSLIFTHPFKFRTTSLVCKITTATTTLRSVLGDQVLIEEGRRRLFVVNSGGEVVSGAGLATGDYIKLSPQAYQSSTPGSLITFEKIHQLGGPLAALSDVDFESESVAQRDLPDGYLAVVYPFDEGYLRLVSVSELTPFVNRKVQVLLVIGIIVSGLPFLVGFILAIIFGLKQKAAHSRMLQRERDMMEAQLALAAAKAGGNLVGALAGAAAAGANVGRRRR